LLVHAFIKTLSHSFISSKTILFWSTVPILFLILLLLILIIYACCLVCTGNRKYSRHSMANAHGTTTTTTAANVKKSKAAKRDICKYKTFVMLFTVLLRYVPFVYARRISVACNNNDGNYFASGSLGFIVFGSETFHHSYKQIKTNVNNFTSQFKQLNDGIDNIKHTIGINLNETIKKYEQELNMKYKQQKAMTTEQYQKIQYEIKGIRGSLDETVTAFQSFNQILSGNHKHKSILKDIDLIEETRWGIMIGVVTINLLLILLLVIGVIRNSKGSLCL
jgi:hypothetical protein